MGRRKNPAVPARLVAEIERALARVDVARARLDRTTLGRTTLDRTTGAAAPLPQRRRAHAELRAAYLDADALLREATRSAKAHSYREGSHWRHRLSTLDLARQRHLFEESDDPAALRLGTVRAVDTGMSGPAIGDHLHGRSKAPGAPETYGLDLEAILTTPAPDRVLAAPTATASGPLGTRDVTGGGRMSPPRCRPGRAGGSRRAGSSARGAASRSPSAGSRS